MLKQLIFSLFLLLTLSTCGPKVVIGVVSDVQFSERDKVYKITALTPKGTVLFNSRNNHQLKDSILVKDYKKYLKRNYKPAKK
jgi:hypothetical protein